MKTLLHVETYRRQLINRLTQQGLQLVDKVFNKIEARQSRVMLLVLERYGIGPEEEDGQFELEAERHS